ncbi:MAG: N-formylglutamate deformylase [Beijerinckiaceae bacterium]
MAATPSDWLEIRRGDAPLVVSIPHTGITIPAEYQAGLVSPWLARKDCDWWIETLYDFAAKLDATVIRTSISRTVIDVNREPSGASLYPGQFTTGLCPTTTFDGEALYQDGLAPDERSIAQRKQTYFDPYHAALRTEIMRLRASCPSVVLYDCHSIRSVIPSLFEGTLPHFNIGTNAGASCDPKLTAEIAAHCAASGMSHVVNGRFKGGTITRTYGDPSNGVHAVQMELACRAYIDEPLGPVSEAHWPTPYEAAYAAPTRATLTLILQTCRAFALSQNIQEKP